MLAKAHFANFFLHPTAHLLDAKVIIATRKWLLQHKSGYCNAKVVITTQKLLLKRKGWLLKREFLYRLPFRFSVSDNTFAALNVADFEELTFNYGL